MTHFKAVVADIGGTNTRVALTHGTRVRHDTIRRFRNAENTGINAILTQYLPSCKNSPTRFASIWPAQCMTALYADQS